MTLMMKIEFWKAVDYGYLGRKLIKNRSTKASTKEANISLYNRRMQERRKNDNICKSQTTRIKNWIKPNKLVKVVEPCFSSKNWLASELGNAKEDQPSLLVSEMNMKWTLACPDKQRTATHESKAKAVCTNCGHAKISSRVNELQS